MHDHKYPSTHAMMVLGGVWLGSTVAIKNQGIMLHVEGPRTAADVPVPDAVLDELEDRGWLEIIPDAEGMLRATEKGAYHARAWLEKRLGKAKN